MVKEQLFTVVATHPVHSEHCVGGVAELGYMAIVPGSLDRSWGRKVPENTIIQLQIQYLVDRILLSNVIHILTVESAPLTESGATVIGYEDPTHVPAHENPFTPGQEGFLATQVFKIAAYPNPMTSLVYATGPEWKPDIVISPFQLNMDRGFPKQVQMVKEGELAKTDAGKEVLFYEYAEEHSDIGVSRLVDGKAVLHKPFYTIDDAQPGTEHLSTGSTVLTLPDGRQVMFYNRREKNEWGIGYMLYDNHRGIEDSKNWYIDQKWLIRADDSEGVGPGDQKIAFASCAEIISKDPVVIRLFYHVNDIKTYCAIIEMTDRN